MTLRNIFFFILLSILNVEVFSSDKFSIQDLSHEIIKRTSRVEEFVEIKKISKEIGLKNVYLFGGTAAAYAHYVYWDLLRESGDKRYDKSRFDYDYSSMFRSNQDMDIVIDGTSEQARELESKLSKKFPFFQGKKSVWEVRLLKESMSDKDALLNNKDFLSQHTDSNSTGLIDIVSNKKFKILDLRDWENKTMPQFLKDLYSRSLHYYYSEEHKSTKRFESGLNPEIFSVIRFLTKAFQYELNIKQTDLHKIKNIIESFDAKNDLKEVYTRKWIEKNGIKLFQNAVNIEYAWNTLEEIGLRQKLIETSEIINQKELAWWLNKEPLRSYPLGGGVEGSTARDLNLKVVAHETNSFDAYESITKSTKGSPNVFISRANSVGEAAIYGDGFYTAIGKKGMKGTGLTIRFEVNQEAVLGKDFLMPGNDMVIFLNKNALKVINETYKFNVVEYFKLLINGFEFDFSDSAVKEKLKRKLQKKNNTITKNQEKQIVKMIKDNFNDLSFEVIEEFFRYSFSKNYPEIVQKLIEKDRPVSLIPALVQYALSKKEWADKPEFVEMILEKYPKYDWLIVEHILSKEHWGQNSRWLELIVNRSNNFHKLAVHVFSKPHWEHRVDIIKDHLINDKFNGSASLSLIKEVLSQPHMNKHSYIIDLIYEYEVRELERIQERNLEPVQSEKSIDKAIVENILIHSEWYTNESLVQKIYERGYVNPLLIEHVLSKEYWKNNPDLINELIKDKNNHEAMAKFILSQEFWANKTKWIEKVLSSDKGTKAMMNYAFKTGFINNADKYLDKIVRSGKYDYYIVEDILSDKRWIDRSDWIEDLIKRDVQTKGLIKDIFSQEEAIKYEHLIEKIIKEKKHLDYIASFILSKSHWSHKSDWIDFLINQNGRHDALLLRYVLNKDHFDKKLKEKWLDIIIKRNRNSESLISFIFKNDEWSHRQDWIEKFMSDPNNMENLIRFVFTKSSWLNKPNFIKSLLMKNNKVIDQSIAYYVLEQTEATKYPEWVEILIDRGEFLDFIMSSVLSKQQWKDHPYLIEKILLKKFDLLYKAKVKVAMKLSGTNLSFRERTNLIIDREIFSKPHWRYHPHFLKLLDGEEFNTENIRKKIIKRNRVNKVPKFCRRFFEQI